MGFGINNVADIKKLKPYADILIVGSALIRAFNAGGLDGVEKKLLELLNAL